MTVFDPTGGEDTLLDALVADAHKRLTDLLLEAGRSSPPPPQVAEIDRQLDHELRAHFDTVAHVLGPDLTCSELHQLRDDRDQVLEALVDHQTRHDVTSMRNLLNRFCDHIELEELTLLSSVGDRVGEHHMAALGSHYRRMLTDTRVDKLS